MPNPSPEAEITLHSLWEDLSAVLLRRKKLVVLVALATIVAVYGGLMFIGDLFEANASLLVKIGRENAEIPVTIEKGGLFPQGVRKEDVNSYIALLTSRPLLEATIQEIGVERFNPELPKPETLFGWVKYGLKKSYRWGRKQLEEFQILAGLKRRLSDPELAYLALSRNLHAEREKDSDVIVLRLRLPDANLGREALAVLTEKYLARHIQVIGHDRSAAQVFEEQALSYGDAVFNLREKAAKVKLELGVSSVNEQRLQLFEMLKAAELGRLDAEREQARIEGERKLLLQRRSELSELQLSSKSVGTSALRTRIRQSLADLKAERSIALTKYQSESDPVKKVESQIKGLEAALELAPDEEDAERTLSRNPILVLVEGRLAEDEFKAQALESMLAKTVGQVAQIKSELVRIDQADAVLQKLQLEISVNEARFLSNASRREEARGQDTLDRWKVANVSLLSPASASEKPVSPNRLLIMGLGVLGGVLVGIICALVVEWKGEVIYGPRDIERIGPGLWLGTFALAGTPAGAGAASQGPVLATPATARD